MSIPERTSQTVADEISKLIFESGKLYYQVRKSQEGLDKLHLQVEILSNEGIELQKAEQQRAEQATAQTPVVEHVASSINEAPSQEPAAQGII